MRRSNLYLGFDSGCGRCRDVAESVESTSGGRLSVLPLSDERMLSWRRGVFGGDPPHAPTLVEVRHGSHEVRAWVGVRMAAVLASRLGLKSARAILREIAPKLASDRLGDRSELVSRSTFLRGLVGVAAAWSVLSVVSGRPSPAHAATGHWFSGLKITGSEELGSQDSAELAAELERSGHAVPVFPNSSPAGVRYSVRSAVAESYEPRAVVHSLQDGRTLEAVVLQEGVEVSAFYTLKNGQDVESTHSLRMSGYDSTGSGEIDRVKLVLVEENGHIEYPPQGRGDRSLTGSSRAASGCDSSACSARGSCWACRCSDWDLRCLFNCCAPCSLSCTNVYTCLGCVALFCPICTAVNSCCMKSYCGWREACS